MQTQSQRDAAAIKRATALAASADPARNSNEPERIAAAQKLFSHCEKHGLDAFAFAPFLRPEPAAHEKPASDASQKRQARQALSDAARVIARKYYNGCSLAAHKTDAAPRATYAARVLEPVQKAKSVSPRDESGLALILSDADADGIFDPVRIALDVGILSRLSSQSCVEMRGDAFALTERGAALAAGVVSRAA